MSRVSKGDAVVILAEPAMLDFAPHLRQSHTEAIV